MLKPQNYQQKIMQQKNLNYIFTNNYLKIQLINTKRKRTENLPQ